MAEWIVHPFRGIHYDTAKMHDISLLIAPPFDVISPEMQGELYARNAHNFVRLERPRAGNGETETDHGYARAADTLRRWLAEGVLVREDAPALYVVETEFSRAGRTWRRRGVFALIRIPEEGESYVLAHEATFSGPKADRFQLMTATQAMISPVLAMCEDAKAKVLSALQTVDRPPDAEGVDHTGVRHRLWIARDEALISAVCAAVGPGPIYILDGHHRFETARAYRDQMRRAHPTASARAGFNFALLLLVSARDEGMRILPSHRLVSGLGREGVEWITARLGEHFDVHPRPRPDWDRVEDLLQEESARGRHVFASYCADGGFAVLAAREELLPVSDSPVDQLDVTVLHRELLDLTADLGEVTITYTADAKAAAAAVLRGECDFAFLLRPTTVEQVIAVARAGELMPHKSTYFYPKAPAGLVISDASPEPI